MKNVVNIPEKLTEFTVFEVFKKIYANPQITTWIINFKTCKFVYPTGTVMLSQFIKNMMTDGCTFNIIKGQSAGYLERIGFDLILNPNSSEVKSSGSTFIPISLITLKELRLEQYEYESFYGKVEHLNFFIVEYSQRVCRRLFKKDIKEISYCFREIIRNVFEHSNTDKCHYFAQIYPNLDVLEFCICDCGVGIKQSLKSLNPTIPHSELLLHSINPGISGKDTSGKDEWTNSGFGLYVLSELGKRFGYLSIVSGDEIIRISDEGIKRAPHFFQGTAICLYLQYSDFINNKSILDEIIKNGERIAKENGFNSKASLSTYDF